MKMRTMTNPQYKDIVFLNKNYYMENAMQKLGF